MIEAAIVGMFAVTALLGVVEYGLGFFDYLTTTTMTRVGARTGSTLGNASNTDYQLLRNVSGATSSMPVSNIQAITVYKASGVGAEPIAACKTGSVSGVCNFYTAADLTRPSTDFGCGSTSPDRYWCPTTRHVGASATGSPPSGPPDYVGVYIKVVHHNTTDLFGSSFTYQDQTVIRIEAQTP